MAEYIDNQNHLSLNVSKDTIEKGVDTWTT